jgi:hypothetical protein
MRTTSRAPRLVSGIALLTCLLITASVPGVGQQTKETIDASAFGTSTQLGKHFTLRIIVYKFSSPEDRAMLVKAFQKGQNDGLVNKLENMKSVGRIQTPGTLGYDLSFIREIETPTGRTIRFVASRKIALGEAFGNTESKSFNLTAGEININKSDKDKSDGVLFPAAQLIVNAEGELQFDLRQNAWKLNNVHEWK